MILNQKQQLILEKAKNNENIIILGQALTGKTTLSVQILLNKIIESNHETLILVPNNIQVKQINALISENLTQATKGVLVRTPASFALHIAETWCSERTDPVPTPEVASVAKQNILIKEIIATQFDEISTNLHSDFINTDEFASSTIDAIELCEDYNISPELLKTWAKELSKPNWDLLAKILENINERIDAESKTRTQGRLISANRIQYYASHLLENWDTAKYIHQVKIPSPLPKCVIIEDLQNYTKSTHNMIRVLKKLGVQIIITSSPDQTVRKTIGNRAKEVFSLAKELEIPVIVLEQQYVTKPNLFSLQKHLTKQLPNITALPYRSTIMSEENQTNSEIDIKIFKNEYEEHLHIARLIREKNILENIPLNEIIIIVPSKSAKTITKNLLETQNIKCQTNTKNTVLNKSNLIKTILETIIVLDEIQTKFAIHKNEKITLQTKETQNIKLDTKFIEIITEIIKNSEKNYTEHIINLATSTLVGLDRQTIKRIELILQNTFIQENKEKNSQTEQLTEEKPQEKNQQNFEINTQQTLPTIIDLIFSNETDAFFENNEKYVPPKTKQQIQTLQKIIIETFKIINTNKTDVEKTLWTLWENSGKATQWQNQVLLEEEGYEKIETDLDNLIILFDEAFWWSKRHQRGTTAKFSKEKLAEEIETDTVAKLGIKPSSIKILTPEETVGVTSKHVIIRGLTKNVWPASPKKHYVYETDILNQLLGQEITLEELSNISAVTKTKMIFEESWQKQISLLLQAVRTSTDSLLFTAIESESNVPSIFIKMLNDELGKNIYANEDGETIYVHEKQTRTLDLQTHIINLRKELARPECENKDTIAKLINVLHKHKVYGADYMNWHRQLPITSFYPALIGDEEYTIGPSTLDSVQKCPLNWFLQSRAGGGDPSGPNQLIGDFIHAIAEKYPNIENPQGENVEEKIRNEAEEKIQELSLSDSFFDRQKLKNIRQLVENYIEYIKLHPEYVETEKTIKGILSNIRGTEINISGSVDRVEHIEDNKVIIADLKTSSKVPGKTDVQRHTQLGVYQIIYNNMVKDKSTSGARIIPLSALHEETDRVKRVHMQPAKNESDFFESYFEVKDKLAENLGLDSKDLSPEEIKTALKKLKETELEFYVSLDEKIEEIDKTHSSPILVRKPQPHSECAVCRILSETGENND